MAEALDNLQVQYTYHVHTGSAGTTANGCYTKPSYHVHTGNSSTYGGCYTTVVSDNPTLGNHNTTGGYNMNGGGSMECCVLCGATLTFGDANFNTHYTEAFGKGCPKNIVKHNYTYGPSCGKTTNTVEGYVLGCGKTTDTIESATIIF